MELKNSFHNKMSKMSIKVRIELLSLLMLVFGLGTSLILTLNIHFLQNAEIIVPSIAIIFLTSFVFPPYLFVVALNSYDHSQQEVDRIRSAYIRQSIILVIWVFIIYLMTVVTDEAIYIRDTGDSCNVTVAFFKFNIC